MLTFNLLVLGGIIHIFSACPAIPSPLAEKVAKKGLAQLHLVK